MFKRILSGVLALLLCFALSIPSFADVPGSEVWTSSNAILFSPSEMNSGIMPMSSMGTVSNTISSAAKVSCQVFYHDDEGRSFDYHTYATYRSGRWHFSTIADGIIYQINFVLRPDGLPVSGTYKMGFDFASDFSYDYSSLALRANQYSNNVATNSPTVSLSSSDWSQYSGDLYIPSYPVELGNLDGFWIRCGIPSSQNLTQVGGSFAFNFSRSSDTPSSSIGYDTSTQDFQNSVSTTTNAIYDTLQELIQHISNQLAALWDQMYGLMHVPTMAKLDQILSAIQNINLDVTVDLDELKASISQMSQAITGKVQEQISNDNVNRETIVNGYDNSDMESDQGRLSDSLTEYGFAEDDLMQDVNDGISGIDFDFDFSGKLAIIAVVSGFLQELYESSGGFRICINLALILSLASCCIGLYRLKGGD